MSQASKVFLNHVAILVTSLENVTERLVKNDLSPGPIEEWESEGTREVYFGKPGECGRLLLMQPLQHGPYQRALEKRGPGLHHLGIDVQHLDEFVDSLSGSGWYLHPHSVKSMRQSRTAWLARPGVALLIEVHEVKTLLAANSSFITQVRVPVAKRLLMALQVNELELSADALSWIHLENLVVNIESLVQD